jgi:hypothetical protein
MLYKKGVNNFEETKSRLRACPVDEIHEARLLIQKTIGVYKKYLIKTQWRYEKCRAAMRKYEIK